MRIKLEVIVINKGAPASGHQTSSRGRGGRAECHRGWDIAVQRIGGGVGDGCGTATARMGSITPGTA